MEDVLALTALIASGIQAYRYCTISLCALQIYEWLLLLSEEIYLIHQARLTSIKVAYLFCRYYPLLIWPAFLWSVILNHEPRVCAPLVHVIYAFIVPLQASPQAVMLIRTFAFTGQKRAILFLLLTSYLVLMGSQIWTFTADISSASPVLHPFVGNTACLRLQNMLTERVILRTALVLYGSFFFDLLCVIVVMAHYISTKSIQGRLGETFLNQGMIGFGAMTIGNLFAATENIRPIRSVHGLALPFSLILNNIIACRLILHLRRSVTRTEPEELREQSLVVRQALDALRSDAGVDPWVC